MAFLNKEGFFCRLQCDQCHATFQREWRARLEKKLLHFCNRECYKLGISVGGIGYLSRRGSCLEKLGVEHSSQLDSVKKKRAATCLEKYGGNAPMCSPEVSSRARETVGEKYGDHFSRLDWVKSKKRKTCLEKYGVDSFAKTAEFRGMVDWQEHHRAANQTRLENGLSKVSKAEEKFGDFLREHFRVEVQVPVNNWVMDFYLPELDCYLQFDGNYWHGLDKSDEELLNSKAKVDHVILLTKMRDREKERWFQDNKMRLIRVAESDFKNKKWEEILRKIGDKDDR